MSAVYLIRHGQAGLRHNYDALSDLGRTQARLLGEYLAAQKIQFSASTPAACRTGEIGTPGARGAGASVHAVPGVLYSYSVARGGMVGAPSNRPPRGAACTA